MSGGAAASASEPEPEPKPRLIGCGASGGVTGSPVKVVTKLIVRRSELPLPPSLNDYRFSDQYVIMSPQDHGADGFGSLFDKSGDSWEAGDLMLLPPKGAFVFTKSFFFRAFARSRSLVT